MLFLLLALSIFVPLKDAITKDDDERRKPRSPGALTVPLAGTVVNQANRSIGLFTGTLTINRFARQNGELVAVGIVRGTVTLADQVVKTGLETIVLPVSTGLRTVGMPIPPSAPSRLVPVSSTQASSGQFILAQAQSCDILQLSIGGTTVNLLGFMVNLSPITLDISGDSAGPLGALVCQILALLARAADVVGLLNSLLGVLTGLVGGLVGGLGG
jgi:hypothetical protein